MGGGGGVKSFSCKTKFRLVWLDWSFDKNIVNKLDPLLTKL